MTIFETSNGRFGVGHAAPVRPWLLLLLLALLALLMLDDIVHTAAYLATGSARPSIAATPIFRTQWVVYCASPLLAGWSIDRFGLKPVISLVVIGWCAMVTISAFAIDPFTYRIFGHFGSDLLGGFAITAVLVVVRLAWPVRRRAIVLAVLLIAYHYAAVPHGLYWRLFARPVGEDPTSWQYPMLAMATVGTALFALWFFGLRQVDEDSGFDLRPRRVEVPDVWRAILADPRVWSVLAILFCVTLVLRGSARHPWDYATWPEGLSGFVMLALTFATPVAFLAAAWRSDQVYNAERSWLAGRHPYLVAAFLTAAAVPLVGLLSRQQSGPLLAFVDAVALGGLQLADFLVVDLAPRPYAARFIGFVLAGELTASHYVGRPLESLAYTPKSGALLIAVLAVAGAGLTAMLLPRLRPETT